MRNHNQNAENSSLAVNNLRHPSEFIDEVRGYLDTSRILGDLASPDGVAMTLLHGSGSSQVDAIGNFQPGVDPSRNIEYRATYASGKPQSKKTLGHGSPSKLHLVIDEPARTEMLEGKRSYRFVGNYVLAVTAVIGEVIGDSELRVYHSYSKSSDGIAYDGDVDDAYRAFDDVDPTADQKSLKKLLESVSNSIDDDNEAAIIVSDFMDGYDTGSESFDWESILFQLANKQEDSLWINRIRSTSHQRLAVGQIAGLDTLTVESINRSYANTATAKIDRISHVFDGLTGKTIDIDLDSEFPDKPIVELLVNNSVE